MGRKSFANYHYSRPSKPFSKIVSSTCPVQPLLLSIPCGLINLLPSDTSNDSTEPAWPKPAIQTKSYIHHPVSLFSSNFIVTWLKQRFLKLSAAVRSGCAQAISEQTLPSSKPHKVPSPKAPHCHFCSSTSQILMPITLTCHLPSSFASIHLL